jgi:hypothetical protein
MNLVELQTMKRNLLGRNLSSKALWLELEEFESARVMSEKSFRLSKSSQWKTYLNSLALLGFTKYVQERIPKLKIKSEQNTNTIDNVCYLSIGKFRACLIIYDNLIDDFILIAPKLLTSAKTSAHFYVLLEVSEEEEQLNIHGFLRHDELFKYCQTAHLQYQPDESYQVPVSLFDSELNNLLLYTRFLSPSAIKLPRATTNNNTLTQTKTIVNKALVNLSKWWDGVFEKDWQTTDSIGNNNLKKLTWGYVRSKKPSSRFSISRTKLFDFGILLQNQTLALVIHLQKQKNTEQDVLVQVLPNEAEYLPFGLKLKVTLNPDTPESVSEEVTAEKAENAIQLEFSEKSGLQFKVELSFQDAVIVEEFIL